MRCAPLTWYDLGGAEKIKVEDVDDEQRSHVN
jgi:hypothetical protein